MVKKHSRGSKWYENAIFLWACRGWWMVLYISLHIELWRYVAAEGQFFHPGLEIMPNCQFLSKIPMFWGSPTATRAPQIKKCLTRDIAPFNGISREHPAALLGPGGALKKFQMTSPNHSTVLAWEWLKYVPTEPKSCCRCFFL